jgi:myo-inositol 2-dehydrogenase/D-chiro-inositol 1-dehydrogenase
MKEHCMSTSTLGVGILGAGPVTQAIHLPTLSRLEDVFHVARVMDVDPDVAASVAGRVGAKSTTSMEELLADEDVQIVVICSPHQFHAEQVIAACRAGKQAILCEKPFAMTQEEAEQIAAVSEETGVPIIVGAMHTFDPAWLAAKANWGDLAEKAHTIRYSIILPPNPRFEDFATEVINRPARGSADRRDPDTAHGIVFGSIMGLAIHDLPLVRAFCPDFESVELLSSIVPDPSGYFVNLRIGDRNVEVVATSNRSWIPEWYVEAISDDASVRIDFMPSYVQAGSGTATVRRAGETHVFGPYPMNGYEGEWRFLAELARGTVEPLDVKELIHDLTFAIEIAEKAATAARDTAIQEKEAEVDA